MSTWPDDYRVRVLIMKHPLQDPEVRVFRNHQLALEAVWEHLKEVGDPDSYPQITRKNLDKKQPTLREALLQLGWTFTIVAAPLE